MTYSSKQVTLSNVTVHEAELTDSYVGFASSVSPKGIANGVSVKYAYDPNKEWYVLRVTYNRISKVQNIIDINKAEIYLPLHPVLKVINGIKKRMKETLLPNILFVYTTANYIKSLVDDPKTNCINYYYNHFTVNKYGKNPPLTVGYSEMINFIRVTSVDNDHIVTVEPEYCHYKSGDNVRVIDGDFVGVTGRVARVLGQQRVVVKIEGLCIVATAYLPSAFICPLQNK